MSHITYVERNFRGGARQIIDQANEIINEFRAEGFTLTLRQLYYQFVSRDLIANKQSEYKRLGSIINDARLAGEISWSSIEDRTRNLIGFTTYESVSDFLREQVDRYRIDLREGQKTYLEVWIEKDALTGVIAGTCHNNDVDYFACRGYVSQSEQHDAAMRIRGKLREGYDNAVILHLGDHDPSGIDMTRDIEDRMHLFLGRYDMEHQFNIERLALSMQQVRQYNPPENPAKTTDSRFAAYMAQYGESSWELDALKPKVITKLIQDAIDTHTDADLFRERQAQMEADRARLIDIADDFDNE